MSVDAGEGAKGGMEKVRSFVTFFWDGLPKEVGLDFAWPIKFLIYDFHIFHRGQPPTMGTKAISQALTFIGQGGAHCDGF